MAPVYGLLGEKLGHSLSPQIHKKLCGYAYQLFEMPQSKVKEFVNGRRFRAVNVTIPYKKTVMPLCDFLSPQAERIGSVNTLKVDDEGKIHGYNTDYYGFSYLLKRAGITPAGKKVLILGSGGSSVTVQAVLSDLYAGQIVVISRSGEENYQNLARHYDAQIIVNTTPVGMFPQNLEAPIELSRFNRCEAVVDIIYNPLRTKLLLDAAKLGINCSNGLPMLVAQAKMAAEIFTDTPLAEDEIERVIGQMEKEATNIVLVGMPGCGKSTVAGEIGRLLQREVLDTDVLCTEEHGKSIPEIFALSGEEAFRKTESRMAEKAGCRLGTVIATGGGIVKRPENFNSLKQNGFIVFLERPLKELAMEGRPLSTDIEQLQRLYEERYPLYLEFCDTKITVAQTCTETAAFVIQQFNQFLGVNE